MTTESAGAKIRWSIESKRVFTDLRHILAGSPIELLSFESGIAEEGSMTQRLYLERAQGSSIRNFFLKPEELIESIGTALAAVPSHQGLTFVLKESIQTGVYRTSKQAVLVHAFDVLNYDGDTFFAATLDLSHGLLLGRELDDKQGTVELEIEYWRP